MLDIAGQVKAINQRLKVGRIGVQLELRGREQFISLRCMLPPRPGSGKVAWYQQRLPTGIRATTETLKQAEKLARSLRVSLDENRFNWSDYLQLEPEPSEIEQPPTMPEFLPEIERLFWRTRQRDGSTLNTWQKGYLSCYKTFPVGPITADSIMRWIESSTPGSRRRGHYLTAAKLMCKATGISMDLTGLNPGFTSKPVDPRVLPSDEEIVSLRNAIADPEWQWLYGMLAAYGLRNHEIAGLDFSNFPDIRVRNTNKTRQGRLTIPLYSQWAEAWQLDQMRYPSLVDWSVERGNLAIGQAVTDWFSASMPFGAYTLRHCWARRSVQCLSTRQAAKLMGHSVRVHERNYQAWVDEAVYVESAKAEIKKAGLSAPL